MQANAVRFPAFPSGTARGPIVQDKGLAFVSTTPLTLAEREALRALRRAHDLVGRRIDEALDLNRVTHGLDACALAGDLGVVAQRCAAQLGQGGRS
jgi:hypothetical protein